MSSSIPNNRLPRNVTSSSWAISTRSPSGCWKGGSMLHGTEAVREAAGTTPINPSAALVCIIARGGCSGNALPIRTTTTDATPPAAITGATRKPGTPSIRSSSVGGCLDRRHRSLTNGTCGSFAGGRNCLTISSRRMACQVSLLGITDNPKGFLIIFQSVG